MNATAVAHLLGLLRAVLPAILEGKPVEAAYLYGSRATELATASSDVDIALLTSRELPPMERLQLELGVEQSLADRSHLSNADVRVVNGAPLRFQGRVLSQAVLIYSRNEEYRVAFEFGVRSAYFDFLPVINQMREQFFEKLRQEGLYG